MRIELSNLDDDRGSLAHVYQAVELDLADERVKITQPISVDGRVKQSVSGVQIEGHLKTQIAVECDRCLKPVLFPVNTNFSIEYISEQDYKESAAAELTEKEMSLSVFDGETIDVDDIVREQIMLAVPARLLCGNDCKGICPTCGVDLNVHVCECSTSEIDPRWEALRKLRLIR